MVQRAFPDSIVWITAGKERKRDHLEDEIDEQRKVVDYLDGLQEKVEELKKLQKERAAELDALIPSILEKAFRGEP